MEITDYRTDYLDDLVRIWNEVVEEGVAFPQLDFLNKETGQKFFESQNYVGVALKDKKVVGLHIGEALVKHSLVKGKECNFKLLQFNDVVASNIHARHLYERLGFKMKDDHYEDICPYYHNL